MPGKKGPSVVDPKLLERENKPAMTIAMGMKMSHAATECWRDQVRKEEKIVEEWRKLYNPGWTEEEKAIVARVAERDRIARERAAASPERALLYDGVSKDGKGRKAYLKERHKLGPQDKWAAPLTETQAVGWKAINLPPVRADDPWARKPKNGGSYRRKDE